MKYIIIPLYDHTSNEEAVEICEDIENLIQPSHKPFISDGKDIELDRLRRAAADLD